MIKIPDEDLVSMAHDWLREADADELAFICGMMFGASIYPKINEDGYLFYEIFLNENYAGAFNHIKEEN